MRCRPREKDSGKTILTMFLPQTKVQRGGGEDDSGLPDLLDELSGKGGDTAAERQRS